MRRSRATLAALLALLSLLALIVAPATAGNPRNEHQRILKYWTAQRLADAKPRDFKRDPDDPVFVGPAKPPPGARAYEGTSWTAGGAVVNKTGKVLFTMDGGNWVCSASAVKNGLAGASLLVTAAHCAYDEVNHAFATNWMYVPSFDTHPTFTCPQTEHGCWTASRIVVHDGYSTSGGFGSQATVHDFAVVVVGPGGKSGNTQLDSLGTFGIAYPAITTGTWIHAFGYPALGQYDGKDLTYCLGPSFNDLINENLTWGVTCDMTGGSSGGPWIAGFGGKGAGGAITSLNSYGYQGWPNMYGPKFSGATKLVYDNANDPAQVGNQSVP